MGEKHILDARQRDAERKERENHFLRFKLYNRLVEMEENSARLGWDEESTGMEDDDIMDEDPLDRAGKYFENYKRNWRT